MVGLQLEEAISVSQQLIIPRHRERFNGLVQSALLVARFVLKIVLMASVVVMCWSKKVFFSVLGKYRAIFLSISLKEHCCDNKKIYIIMALASS